MAEAAAADHGDHDPACRNERRKHERSFVTYAAGGMFIDLSCGKFGEVEDFARTQHGVGQDRSLGSAKTLQDHGHEPGGNLIVGDVVIGVGADEVLDLRARQLDAVALLPNHIDGPNIVFAHLSRNPSGSSSVMWL